MPKVENMTMLFGLLVMKSFFSNLGSSMVLNAINIIIVRMQNVDYRHNKSLYKAVRDLFYVDKHRMFYRGLVPISVAYMNL